MINELKKALEGKTIKSISYDGSVIIITLKRGKKPIIIKISVRPEDTRGNKRDFPWLIIEKNNKEIFSG